MRKTIVIITILIISALLSTLFGIISDNVSKMINPTKYSAEVEKYSEQYNVPKQIVYAVIKTESSFKPDAVSKKGAIGLMQITPDTFEWLCSKTGEEPNSLLLYDPDTNIRYGTYFLSLLHNEYKVWDTVFAAYNAGRTRVNLWLEEEKYNNNGKLINIPYKETSEYINKVNSSLKLYERLYFSKNK